jgi:hypothetical protein
MRSRTTRRFRDALASLPAQVQQQARQAYRLFLHDPAHPSLQFKKVHTTEPVYSARIGLGYRAVGVVKGSEVVWFWVGSHADYDKLLAQL